MRQTTDVPVGARVRHRGTGDYGVVIGGLGAELQVAFGSGTQYLGRHDVEALVEPLRELERGALGDPTAAWLRLLVVLLDHSRRFDPGATLHNARLAPQLHQVFVAHRVVAEKPAPRMILADEVGLGKTIEAGLIIKELRARKALNRVLIVAPASLTTQWESELRAKFNEQFQIIDGVAARHLGRSGTNPFLAVDNVICSLPFATSKARSEQILEAGWDMVVFDEAHRVRRIGVGSGMRTNTQAYRLAEELRDHVDGLLLLSATPFQLDPSELYNLIELVEPGLFLSFRAFQERKSQIPELNALLHSIERWPALSAEQRELVKARHRGLLVDLPGVDLDGLDDALARQTAKEALSVLHPLAYAMVRNRKRELNLAGERQAHQILVELTDAEREIYEEVSSYIQNGYDAAKREKNLAVGFLMVTYQKMLSSSSNALRVSFRRRIEKLRAQLGTRKPKPNEPTVDRDDPDELSTLAGELDDAGLVEIGLWAEIAQLTDLASRLDDIRDSKLARAVKLVDRLRADAERGEGRKIVIFTQFIETQTILAQTLEIAGHRVVVFNGRQSMEEKDNAVRAFRERADILVSTEAGGEGRNLQFASALINFDLPWNPMKVEQRIGRLDRIGQTEIVEIFNLVAAGTLEERIVDVLVKRIRLFEESVGNLDPILGTVEQEIKRLAMGEVDDGETDAWERLGAGYQDQVAEARLLEEQMSDFVLDRASFRRAHAELLGDATITTPADVRRVVEASLDYLGGSVLEHSEGGETVVLPPRVATELGLARQGHRGVFDPQEAVRRDDLEFLAVGHSLIDRILDTARSLPGSVTGCRRSSEAPPGIWVEVLWRITSRQVVDEAVMIRHLIGADAAVLSSELGRLPIDDTPIDVEAPSWVGDAVAASERAFQVEYAAHRVLQEAKFAELRDTRLRREERMFAARGDRLERRVAADRQWLEERSHGDISAADRRVLPARRGVLEKLRAELAALEVERAQRLARIEREPLVISAEVLAAGLVVGPDAAGGAG